MKMQLSLIIVLLGVMMEFAEFGDTYKHIRPYKYYNPHPFRPHRSRPARWHPFPKTPKHYHSKRIPAHKHHPYDPHYRYAPLYEDSGKTSDADKPYVIVIQLPRRKEKHKSPYQRLHVAEPAPSRDTDYIDNDDELQVYQFENKKLRIKVNDQLSLLTS